MVFDELLQLRGIQRLEVGDRDEIFVQHPRNRAHKAMLVTRGQQSRNPVHADELIHHGCRQRVEQRGVVDYQHVTVRRSSDQSDQTLDPTGDVVRSIRHR